MVYKIKYIVVFLLLINMLFSSIYLIRQFPNYLNPFKDFYVLFFNTNYIVQDYLIIEKREIRNSTDNRFLVHTKIKGKFLSDKIKGEIVFSSSDVYTIKILSGVSNNKLPIVRNKLTNTVLIDDPKFFRLIKTDTISKIYLTISFIFLLFIIIYRYIKYN